METILSQVENDAKLQSSKVRNIIIFIFMIHKNSKIYCRNVKFFLLLPFTLNILYTYIHTYIHTYIYII
jgi:uncharacterized membrane protein (DUF106 family)